MRRVLHAVLAVLFVASVLMPLVAHGDEPACRREGDRVSCDAPSFKLLTDACVQAKADAQTCALQLTDAHKDILAREVEMQACQAALAAVPPPAPPPSATKPLLGYGAGVASTVLLVASLVAPLPDSVRLTLGGVGVVGLAGGVILVLPR